MSAPVVGGRSNSRIACERPGARIRPGDGFAGTLFMQAAPNRATARGRLLVNRSRQPHGLYCLSDRRERKEAWLTSRSQIKAHRNNAGPLW